MNHPRSVDIAGRKLLVSSLYRWFRDDFGGSDREILPHLKAYASPELTMKLGRFTSIDGDSYDWRLNDAG